jgi:transposase
MRQTQRYTAEFRADAIALIERNDRTIAKVAEDLGIPHWTLRAWYKAHRMAKQRKPKPVARSPRELLREGQETAQQKASRLERENEALRKKVASLEIDREILKKAAAFFAKESE